MTFARAATGFIAALVAFVALAPSPASAATVLQAALVCANVTLSPFSIVQSNDTTKGKVTLTVDNHNDLKAHFQGQGLPAGQDAQCAVLCVVDGFLDLFEFEAFVPCGKVTASGKLNTTQTIPLGDSFTEPFNGGCLLSVGAFLVPTAVPGQAVVCSPGFGRFNSLTF